MHKLNVGVVEFIVTACYVLIFSFTWRAAAASLSDKPLGRAMAAVHS